MEFKSIAQAKRLTGLSYLGSTNSSAKIAKNGKVHNVDTYIIYLSPAETSGYNVCQHSTIECRKGCLNTSGRVKMETETKRPIQDARIKKTKLFFEHNEFFMAWMFAEIESYRKLAEKKGHGFSTRLNGTSDIDFTNYKHEGQTVYERFSDIQHYDYTKDANKVVQPQPSNYHVTFSYSGRNEAMAKFYLKKGGNVAVVFNVAKETDLPETWNGYPVINGDESDVRYKDGSGVVVGLKWKNIANKELNNEIKNSCFVVQVFTPAEKNELKMVEM